MDGLRKAVADMARGGANLADIASAIVETAGGLDSERRAALWLYARSCVSDEASAPAGALPADNGRVHASGRSPVPSASNEGEVHDMPYLRCPRCGVTSYVARNRWRAGECPSCGELLDAEAVPARAGARSRPENAAGIAGALALAREQLGMDTALLTEVDEGVEVVLEAAGEWPPLGSLKGGSIPFEDTFCKRLMEGLISNFVIDAREDERVHDLEMARRFGVGAWIGVPLRLSDARLYILCCLAREARPALDEEDVNFMRGLGESVRAELEPST